MQSICNKICALSLVLVAVVQGDDRFLYDILYGHFEVHTDYDESDGWNLSPSYNLNDDFNDRSQIRRLPADQTRFIAPPRARVTLGSALSFLGPEGSPAWILPKGFELGNQYLGMRVIVNPGVFQTRVGNNYSNFGKGSVSMRLVSVTGTGPDRGGSFALWETDPFGLPQVYFNSGDGIDDADLIPSLPAGAHSHFNWGFTREGSYEVALEVFARLRGTGTPTQATSVFNFIIPHSGHLDEVRANLCFQDGDWAMPLVDLDQGVAFGERRAVVQVPESTVDGEPYYSCPCSILASSDETGEFAGLTREIAHTGAEDSMGDTISLTLKRHLGPGDAFHSAGFDTRDGIDGEDKMDLANPVRGTLTFTESGIHTLFFEARGIVDGGSEVVSSPLVIRCLAGLDPDYSFAEWADSFERAYDLPAGSLADPSGDYNQDGNDHQLEYLMEAGGSDPVSGGSFVAVDVTPSPGMGRMVFLRDLFKDNLATSSPRLVSSMSHDLINWTFVGPRAQGQPLDFMESGAARGNALSNYMLRNIQRVTPASGRDFFRLEIR